MPVLRDHFIEPRRRRLFQADMTVQQRRSDSQRVIEVVLRCVNREIENDEGNEDERAGYPKLSIFPNRLHPGIFEVFEAESSIDIFDFIAAGLPLAPPA